MMAEWVRSVLDIVLIVLVGGGLVQATRLIRHLQSLRASRLEMERFVHEFGSTVLRAETGIRNLKAAARESGDDLEKLVDKSRMAKDELQFLVESADQLAERLSHLATSVPRPGAKAPEPPRATAETKPSTESRPAEDSRPAAIAPVQRDQAAKPSSRAERELMQALQKLS
ncbi:MAG: DUF6468 domain-containing protein [Pseudomonadota bacterium]|nr:DUF6468 domain-containing protein [Pseudomonadota bacterium]